MDNCGVDISESGLVLSHDELQERRQRNGQCPECGQQCFRKKALKLDKSLLSQAVLDPRDRLEAVTVPGLVLKGRCLICNPQTEEELERERLVSAQAVAVFFDNANPPVLYDDDAEAGESDRAVAMPPARSAESAECEEDAEHLYNCDGGKARLSPSIAGLSHDDFFSQFDTRGKKSTKPGDLSRSMPTSSIPRGDRHTRRRPDPRSRDKHSNRGGRKKPSMEKRIHSDPSMKSDHPHDRSWPGPGKPSRRDNNNHGERRFVRTRSHGDDKESGDRKHFRRTGKTARANRPGSHGGDKNPSGGHPSERIGTLMRKSRRRLNYARTAAQVSSSSSSSSDSDDDSNDDSSDSSSSSGSDDESTESDSSTHSTEEEKEEEEDGAEALINGSSHSWREKSTPQEKMQSILDHLAEAAVKAASDLTRTREERSELSRRERTAKKTKWYASKQVKDAQEQQAAVLEREDYEAADGLGLVIHKNLKALKKQTAVCSDIHRKIVKIDSQKKEAVSLATGCLKEAQVKLSELHDELVDFVKEGGGMMSQHSLESDRLSFESKRLAQELKVIEQEEESFANEKKQLVGGEVTEFEEQLKDHSAKLADVNEKIKDLREQLAKAEAEAAHLNEKIAVCKENIEDIQDTHSFELEQLEVKFSTTKEKRSAWDSQNKKLNEDRNFHEATIQSHSGEVKTWERVIMDADKESLAAIELEKILAGAFDIEETKECRDDEDDAAEVDDVAMCEALVEEKQELLIEAKNNIGKLGEEISRIEADLPVLEAKKKAAAMARDIQSAARASRKIKKALARREQCRARLDGEAMEQKRSAKEALETHTKLLEIRKRAAEENGREAGTRRMEQLREASGKLRSTLTRLAGASGEEATKVSVSGGALIHAQLSVLAAEGRTLGEKYGGGWEEAVLDDDDAVVRFLAPILGGGGADVDVPNRGKTRLTLFLEEKMGAALSRFHGESLGDVFEDIEEGEVFEDDDGQESHVGYYTSSSTKTMEASQGSIKLEQLEASEIFEA